MGDVPLPIRKPKDDAHIGGTRVHVNNNWFNKYKRECVIKEKRLELKNDFTLKRLKYLFKELRYEITHFEYKKEYDYVTKLIKDLRYTSGDITNFSIALTEFQKEDTFGYRAGIFLSALINNCNETDFLVVTEHLVEKPSFLGYNNTKNITVKGDVSGEFGYGMESGIVIIGGNADWNLAHLMKKGDIIAKGNVKDNAGYEMYGGSIIVEGNVGKSVGLFMNGGKIIVNGNAGGDVGKYLWGGEIHLNGEYKTIGSEIRHGKIYHKEKLIVNKEEGIETK